MHALDDIDVFVVEIVPVPDYMRARRLVLVADWSCGWSGLGVAEKLARDGHYVRLLSGASIAGESIQAIVRDQWIGDAVSPRTVEEAVLEGLQLAWRIYMVIETQF